MDFESVERIAVIGLGRMGHGIAQTFAVAGYEVQGFDTHVAARESVKDRIESNLRDFVNHGMLPSDDVARALGRIHVCETEADAASGVQFVVEALTEQAQAKIDFFHRIEHVVEEDTILASNSSTFTISESGEKMRRPDRAVVTHWFNPPHLVPTVEVVPGPQTTESVIDCTIKLHNHIGKTAVRLRQEIPGFLVNRVQMAMIREVWDLYERGVASAADIDAAIQGSLGFRLATCGPLAICDFGGLDIWSTVYNRLAPELRSDTRLHESIARLVEEGKLGTSRGEGVHQYDDKAIAEIISQRDRAMMALAQLNLLANSDSNQTPE